jgi:hypothetical protein
LTPLHAVFFELAPDGVRAELSNISLSGFAILRRTVALSMSPGQIIQGALVCGSTRVPLSAEVMHVNDAIVGCRFSGHSAEAHRVIQSYFDLELNALSMIEVKPEMLQADPDGIPHWIHGKNNCEVFFVAQGDRVVRFNLTFFGNYVEGGEGREPRYGQIMDEEDAFSRPRHKGSTLIRWDSSLASELSRYALRFLESVPHLGEEHRKALIRSVRNHA